MLQRLISLLLCVFLGIADCQNSVHFIEDDHIAFINAHTGLCQNLHRLGSHCAVDTDLRRPVSLITSTALVCADTLFLAVQNCLNSNFDLLRIKNKKHRFLRLFLPCA